MDLTGDGTLTVAVAPSAVPTERFRVMPRPLRRAEIRAITDGYGQAAARLKRAGLDGVEIVASHGYLPSQFLNPAANLRGDEYGGTPDGRLRFLREAFASVREHCGPGFVVGLACGSSPAGELLETLESASVPAIGIGDCLAPRTVEEAVLDGLVAASGL